MFDLATLSELGLTRPKAEEPKTQGKIQQDAFLELMVAQFRNQDPFKPMDNGEFLGQLAQFGTVSGIEELKTTMGTLASSLFSDQALQASNLIDRNVLVPGGQGLMTDRLGGAVELEESTTTLSVLVTGPTGQHIRRMELGAQTSGLVEFEWDGRSDDGERMPSGLYSISAIVQGTGGNEEVPVLVEAKVDSVMLGHGEGVTLTLAGLGDLALADVRRIGSPD